METGSTALWSGVAFSEILRIARQADSLTDWPMATAKPARKNLSKQQEAFDAFRQEYNQERPHEALGQQSPSTVYQPSPRAYPQRLPPQRGYADGWEKRMVRKGGQIKWHGKDIRLTQALWGQEIGLQPVGDGLWAVYFEGLELGIFGERKGRVVRPKELRCETTCPDDREI